MATMLNKEVMPLAGRNVRMVFRHFPLRFHNWARVAAEATACAQEQNTEFFWRLHDYLFEHQRELNLENVRQKLSIRAKDLAGFDQVRFNSCIDGKKQSARVERDIAFGIEQEIGGTPTLFINEQQVSSADTPEQILTLFRELDHQNGSRSGGRH